MRSLPLSLVLVLLSGGALAQDGGAHAHAQAQPGAATPGATKPAAAARTAQARFVDAQGKEVGTATLTEGPRGVVVRADFTALPAGERAFHVHEKGLCEPPFMSAGAHWNPMHKQHGIQNPKGMHAGDMPNLVVPADGKLQVEVFLQGYSLGQGKTSLLDKDGSSLMIHAKADDYSSDPTGNAGDRIACAVVERVQAP